MLANTAARTAGTCGAAPAAPTSPATLKATTAPTRLRVRFTWNAATDDAGGAGDVRSYVVEWQKVGDATWKSIGSVAATRASTYEWQHFVPLVSGSYQYAVKAIDCGGLGSARATATALTLP